MKLSLLTNHTSVCNATMVGFESGDTVIAEHLRYTGSHCLAPGIMALATVIFQQNNVRPYVAGIVQRLFVNHQIEFLPWQACFPDLSPRENMYSMFAQQLT
ncbi:transposable element Tcb1 transposase [Trichonephila clavipes]|uniref:Transposable element Tcb1 transposase n=1 Tax=Trichonephila clavipes TaxID=2585209 RepID=A0A8X6VE16_TRICX|nr:transposable element Tcb1 transposase [Trichonephila clavipes]